MSYPATAIANFFIDLALAKGESLTPMKVQKLVFFAHGWHLAIKGAPLIDEQVEAWKFGPVIRSLYRAFREYGYQPIQGKAKAYSIKPGGGLRIAISEPSIDDQPEAAEFSRELLQKIWDVYGKYTAVQLSNMTHAAGTPWQSVVSKYPTGIPKGTDIPQDAIRSYFLSLAKPA